LDVGRRGKFGGRGIGSAHRGEGNATTDNVGTGGPGSGASGSGYVIKTNINRVDTAAVLVSTGTRDECRRSVENELSSFSSEKKFFAPI
jgi:hypothetical protein